MFNFLSRPFMRRVKRNFLHLKSHQLYLFYVSLSLFVLDVTIGKEVKSFVYGIRMGSSVFSASRVIYFRQYTVVIHSSNTHSKNTLTTHNTQFKFRVCDMSFKLLDIIIYQSRIQQHTASGPQS